MAFTMEQGGKYSEFKHKNVDLDSYKTSSVRGHSPADKDIMLKDCFIRSGALEPSKMPIPITSPFSVGMSYKQVHGTHDDDHPMVGESITAVAPCTPCPSFLQQKSQGQKITKRAHAFPSLCLGIGLVEGQQVPCIQRLTTPEKPSSLKDLRPQQFLSGSPQAIFTTPIQGHGTVSVVQREAFKEVPMSSKLSKHETYVQECQVPHPVLSLGNFTTEMPVLTESMGNSRSSHFSFLEALTAGDTQSAQETKFAPGNRMPIPAGVMIEDSMEGRDSFDSGFASLNQTLAQSKSSTGKRLHWASSQDRNSGVFVTNTDSLRVHVHPHAVCSSSPVKQEWSETLKQFPCLYQALSEDKNVAVLAHGERKSLNKRKNLPSSEEVSSSGPAYRNAARQKTQGFEQPYVKQTLEAVSSQKTAQCKERPLEDSLRPAKVKVEVDYEEGHGGQYLHGDSVKGDDEIGRCKSRLHSSSTALYVRSTNRNSECAELSQLLSTVSAGAPALCYEQFQKPMSSQEQTPPMNRTSQIDGCWGKFLGLSASAGQDTVVKADSEIILPFQRRFEHLQEFLKQCDTSNKYSLQAFGSLSAAAMSASAVELETRVVRLSWEESKELKRMKLLNVLGKASEGHHASSSGVVYRPLLPTHGNMVQVKQEI